MSGVSVAAPGIRAASINLCSDQYLIALAAPEAIASVTALAADPQRSAEARHAIGLAINHGAAEEIAMQRPDLVLANAFSDPSAVALIRQLGMRVLVVPDAHDFAGIIANVRLVATALGAPERGWAVIARMEAALGPPAPESGSPPVVATLEPGGYTQGAGSLIDEAVTRAGGVSLARRLGFRGYSSLSLEQLVAAPVALIVEPAESGRDASLGWALLRHPALLQRFAQTPKLAIPGNLTDCPAPASARLVPILRGAIAALTESAPG